MKPRSSWLRIGGPSSIRALRAARAYLLAEPGTDEKRTHSAGTTDYRNEETDRLALHIRVTSMYRCNCPPCHYQREDQSGDWAADRVANDHERDED